MACKESLREKVGGGMPIYYGLKRSNLMVLLAVAFIIFAMTGCGTLKNGQKWGEDAIYLVDFKRIPDAAYHALGFSRCKGVFKDLAASDFSKTSKPIKKGFADSDMNRYDSEKGHNIVAKEGERFRDKKTGKVYIEKKVYKGEVFLQVEDGRGRRFTGLKNLEVTCDKLEDKV